MFVRLYTSLGVNPPMDFPSRFIFAARRFRSSSKELERGGRCEAVAHALEMIHHLHPSVALVRSTSYRVTDHQRDDAKRE